MASPSSSTKQPSPPHSFKENPAFASPTCQSVEKFWKGSDANPFVTNTLDYEYDGLNRLTRETLDSTDNALDYRDDYAFDLTGNRLQKKHDVGIDGSIDSTTTSSFDANDRLLTKTFDESTGTLVSTETFVFGHEGHGSVRVLLDAVGAMSQMFVFDAYGNMAGLYDQAGARISGSAALFANAALAKTTLLYSGEQFDIRIGQQYLRARYYDSTSGRFNRLHPFFGNQQDPQSFHKYGYVHGDPVGMTDPTGENAALFAIIAAIAYLPSLAAAGLNYGRVAYAGGDPTWRDLIPNASIFGIQIVASASTLGRMLAAVPPIVAVTDRVAGMLFRSILTPGQILATLLSIAKAAPRVGQLLQTVGHHVYDTINFDLITSATQLEQRLFVTPGGAVGTRSEFGVSAYAGAIWGITDLVKQCLGEGLSITGGYGLPQTRFASTGATLFTNTSFDFVGSVNWVGLGVGTPGVASLGYSYAFDRSGDITAGLTRQQKLHALMPFFVGTFPPGLGALVALRARGIL